MLHFPFTLEHGLHTFPLHVVPGQHSLDASQPFPSGLQETIALQVTPLAHSNPSQQVWPGALQV